MMADHPNYDRWMAEMMELPSVKAVLGEKRGMLSKDL